MQLLVVDDDKKLASLLQTLFSNNNFICWYALSGNEAKEIINYIKIDALIIDYMMPKQNGLEVIQELQQNNIHIPTLMLTAVDEIDNKLKALDTFVDDYITKPFNSQELIFRVKNIIKRNNSLLAPATIIQIGDLTYNKTTQSLKINNENIKLSSSEEDILKIFIKNINKVITKEDILLHLGKTINYNNLNALNVSIMRLRNKIEKDNNNPKHLKTVRGKGFMLVND